MSNKEAIVLSVIIIMALMGWGVYTFGHHRGFAQGYASGQAAQYANDQTQYTNLSSTYNEAVKSNNDLVDRYNQLSDNYNSLRDAVTAYIGQTRYQPSVRINCSSNTIGITTFTSCF